MAKFQPGQVIRFTYRHFWPLDANSRDPHKEILVLHTRWMGKVHGVDLKSLTPAQLQILKIVMNPTNNRVDGAPATGQRAEDFDALQKRLATQVAHSDMLKSQMESELEEIDDLRREARKRGVIVSPARERQHSARMVQLQNDIDDAVNKEKQPEPQRVQSQEQAQTIPPAAAAILKRMKPARMVNNPRMFYQQFIKPFLGHTDAYRTFFPARMDAIQVDSRWNWVSGSPTPSSPFAPKKPAAPATPAAKFKHQQTMADANAEKLAAMGAQPAMSPTPPSGGASRPLPPGVAESGVMGTPAGTRRGTSIKTERPGVIITRPTRPK
jgi:hypothetical protein